MICVWNVHVIYARIWLLMTSIVLKYRAKQGKNSSEKRQSADILSAVASARLKIWSDFLLKESLKGKTSVKKFLALLPIMFAIHLIK